jgi:hypothetical protein
MGTSKRKRSKSRAAVNVPSCDVPMIKPLMGFATEIEQQVGRFAFEKNVFLMMRFREDNKALSDFIIETLAAAKFRGVRADDSEWNLTNNVYNPIAVLYCCKFGIALFDDTEEHQAFNANVVYELAFMHSLGRQCLILKNDSLPSVPFDLIKDLYMPYKGELAVRTNVQKWLAQIEPKSAIATRDQHSAEAGLEHAVATASNSVDDVVVETPHQIVQSGFKWWVSERGGLGWDLSWSIVLQNKRKNATRVSVQVLFLDKGGFALEDTVSDFSLVTGEKTTHSATLTTSPEIAGRVSHAVATVSEAL